MSTAINVWAGRATPEVASAVGQLFRTSGDPRPSELFEWQYLNPGKEAYVALAHTSVHPFEKVVACYVAFPVPFAVNSKDEVAIQSIDTLTLADFRGQGLLRRLGEAVYDLAQANGVVAVFGFPNEQILVPRERKLGWEILDPLPMVLRPIGLRMIRRRVATRSQQVIVDNLTISPDVETSFSPPSGTELFLREWHTSPYTGVLYSNEYLKWRFARPGANYRFSWQVDGSGKVIAFGASNLTVKRGQAAGQIMCLLSRGTRPSAPLEVLKPLVRDLKRRNAEYIMAWGSPDGWDKNVFRRAGFVPMPPKLRPIKIHFGARPLQGSFSDRVTDRSLWHLTYLDSDTS